MYNIGICDDEQAFAAELEEMIGQYARETGLELRTTLFCNGRELIDSHKMELDLIFLDIQMDVMNGLETAKRIRARDEKVSIIFLTSLTKYALAGYEYQAVNYIIKPIKYVRLKRELDRWLESYRREDKKYILVINEDGHHRVDLSTLYYLETYNRNVKLYTDSGETIPISQPRRKLVMETLLLSTAIYTLSQAVRLLFWMGAWIFLRRYRQQIASENIEKRTWLIADAVMLVPTIAIFTAIFFITQANYIVYPLCVVIILGGLVSVSLIAYMSRSEKTAREAQRLQQQYTYYEDKRKAEEAVRRLYHDMKNHLLLLEKQDSPETRQMAADLRRQIADYEDYIHTGNDFLDIIIRDKARQAKEDEVDFSAVIHFEQGGFLEPIDISTIFGNALDNALEASLKLPPEQRLVTVRAECVRDMLSVVVENNCLPGETGYEKTFKEDKFLHGFGISNIKQAVEKYSGQCLVRQGKECFQLKILLPLP